MVELLIQNGNTIYTPIVPEGVTLDLERKQTGKVKFECVLLLCHLNGTDPKSFLQHLNR